ncbi:MAG: hypothetical protein RLY93_07650 [Sumerlaeia bacterium]
MKRKLSALLCTALLAAATLGCSSAEQQQLKSLADAEKEGRFGEVRDQSQEIVSRPTDFSPEALRQAQEHLERANKRLTTFHASRITSSFVDGDYLSGLGRYERLETEFPQLLEDPSLQRRVMRAQVYAKQYDDARDTAQRVLQIARTERDREDASAVLDRLETIRQAQYTLQTLESTVARVSSKTGFNLVETQMASPCMLNGFELSESEAQAVADFMDAKAEITHLLYEIGSPVAVN